MFAKTRKPRIEPADMAVITAALHTQIKILDVQASAGGVEARGRLNEVKRVLAHLSQYEQPEATPAVRRGFWRMGVSRLFG